MNEYLRKSASCGSPERNASAVAAVEAGIKAGKYAWQAKALTMIHELCDPDVFAWSLTMAKSLNVRFGVKHGTVAGKITDLPGVSISIVPLLAAAGVKALHIGTNGMGNQAFTSFPGVGNLPQVFRWRHPATGDEVIVMNEQGYGRMIVLDEGFGLDTALRWQFTGDNQMPPEPDGVRDCWAYAKTQFPNAEIKASTLDAFALKLWDVRDRLPVVEAEIGNAWLPQMATDPFRLRALRQISRMRKEWIASGKLAADDPDLEGYTTRLIVPIEHNFGMSDSKAVNDTWHTTHWTNAQFHPLREHGGGGPPGSGCSTFDGHCSGYAGWEEYATERDSFLYPVPGDSAGYQAFAAAVNHTIEQLSKVPTVEDLVAAHPGLKEQPDLAALSLSNDALQLKFSPATGAITTLVEKATSIDWAAGENHSFGEFVYRTYTQDHDIDRYICQFASSYCGDGVNHRNKSSDAAGAVWQKVGMDASILSDPSMAHLTLSEMSRAWGVKVRAGLPIPHAASPTPTLHHRAHPPPPPALTSDCSMPQTVP